MSERKVKQTQNYFLKHRFDGSTSSFVRDCGLSFRPHELRIKSVTFETVPEQGAVKYVYEEDGKANVDVFTIIRATYPQVYTLHWQGVGDICAFKPMSDRAADYVFPLKNPIAGQQDFQVRHTTGKAVKGLDISQGELIIHMEFVEYA